MTDNNNNAGIITHPPFFYIGAAGIAVLTHNLYPLVYGVDQILEYAGIILFVVGIVIFVMASKFFRTNKQSPSVHATTVKIYSSGIYGRTRNPLYLGITLWMFAASCYFDNIWLAIVTAPLILVMNKLVIEKEEAYLERTFGDEYLDYKKRVRRWI